MGNLPAKVTGRGSPRTPYERTYVLLSPQADRAWANAVVDATWDGHRYTIGGSADDAGIGDLDVRRVIAVNPDQWRGDLRAFFAEHYPGVEYRSVEASTPAALGLALHRDDDSPPTEPPSALRIGLNDPGDQGGVQWMIQNVPDGLLYVPIILNDSPRVLNFAVDARVVVNLRWNWSTDCGGQGTLPPQGRMAPFVQACISTIQQARGVWGWSMGNEMNNLREWPAGTPLTPEYVAEVYNQVRDSVTANMAPGAVDPFNAGLCDVQEYWRRLWACVKGAGFVDLHGYIHGPDAALCWSEVRFGDAPLTWQYFNFFGCCQTLLERLPTKYRGLPAIVSEFNHIDKGDGKTGWVGDARGGEIVRAAYRRLMEWNASGQGNPVTGLAIYRWRGDAWAVAGNSPVLDAIKELANGT